MTRTDRFQVVLSLPVVLALLLILFGVGREADAATPTPPPASAPAASVEPSSGDAAGARRVAAVEPIFGSVVVEIAVGGEPGSGSLETFHVLLTDPTDIAIAEGLARGESLPAVPTGRLVAGEGVNVGYDWHLDPAEFEWGSSASEACDGPPSAVHGGFASTRYCPTGARVVSVLPAE